MAASQIQREQKQQQEKKEAVRVHDGTQLVQFSPFFSFPRIFDYINLLVSTQIIKSLNLAIKLSEFVNACLKSSKTIMGKLSEFIDGWLKS